AHLGMAIAVDLAADLVSAPHVLTEDIDEEHAPVDDVVERIAGLRELHVVEARIVAIPGVVQPVDVAIFPFQPALEGEVTASTVTEHVAHSGGVVRPEPHLRHGLRELGLAAEIPYLQGGMVPVPVEGGAEKAHHVFDGLIVIEAESEPADLPVRLGLRADAATV